MSQRTVAVNFTANTAPYIAGVRGATTATGQLGAAAAGASGATTGLGAAGMGAAARFLGPAGIVMAVKDAANAAIDFESAALKMQTLVGLTADEADELAAAARNVGVQFGVGSQQAVEAAFFIASAGLRGKNATDALERSAIASALGLGEMATVADLLTSAMNAYGAENLSAARATDILVAGVREGKFEASALAGAIGTILPTASALGVSFEEVVGLLAVWSRTGADVSSSVTSLQAIMSTLLGTTNEGTELLETYGLSLEGLRKIAAEEGGLLEVMRLLDETFGENIEDLRVIVPNVRAFRGVMATLAQEVEIVDGVMGNVADSTRIADDAMQKAFSEDTRLKINRLTATLKDLRIETGRELSPSVGFLADAFTRLFGELSIDPVRIVNPIYTLRESLVVLGRTFSDMMFSLDETLTGTSVRARAAIDDWDGLAAAADLFNGMVRDSTDLLPQIPDLLDGLAESSENAAGWQKILASELGITVGNLNKQVESIDNVLRAKLALIDPVYAAIEAERRYRDALNNVIEVQGNAESSADDLIDAVFEVARAEAERQAAMGQAGIVTDVFVGTLNETIETLGLTAAEIDIILGRLDEYGIKLERLDGTTITTRHEHTEIIYRAGENLEFIGGAWVPMGSVQFRARGGPISAGQPYIVGEEGPELVVPSASGTVMTAGQTAGMLSGGTYNVTVNMPPGADGNQVVEALRRWERSNGPVPIGVR